MNNTVTWLDGDVTLIDGVDWGQPPDALLGALVGETSWRRDSVTMFGKVHQQPRLTAWYGDDGARYRYSGLMLDPMPWTPLLADVRDRVERVTGEAFNSVLLNLYRDGADSMGFHADDEPELGRVPVIASLSLGAVRPLRFKPRGKGHASDAAPFQVAQSSGSVLIMRGNSQRDWVHGIAKTRRIIGPRLNLTFRLITSDGALQAPG